LSLATDDATAAESFAVGVVLADPRSSLSAAQQQELFDARLVLLGMMETAVQSVERIVNARSDVDTVIELIAKQPGAGQHENLKALEKQAREVKKGLDAIEEQFRTPPETKGSPYGDDKIANVIGTAGAFLENSDELPSPTAKIFAERAQVALDAGVTELNRFMSTELTAFSAAVEQAGIGLFRSVSEP